MQKSETYINKIHREFPNYIISSIKKTGEGDNSNAFIINENYIFRFPKRKEVKHQVQREIAVLPKIKPFLNLEIPNFEFVSPGINFVGYKNIPGKPLTNKIFLSLEKKYQQSVHHSLATFLSQLHHIDLSILKDCNLETMDPKEEYSDNFINAQKIIFPYISKNKREIIIRLFNDYLRDTRNFNYTPVLIHNDFSKDHILFDTAKQLLTGIIDFGDIAFGDPDYDLMYLLDEFGEKFLEEIFVKYKPVNKKELMYKLYFFTLGSKLQVILGNSDDKDSDDSKIAFKDLDKWFKKYNSRHI